MTVKLETMTWDVKLQHYVFHPTYLNMQNHFTHNGSSLSYYKQINQVLAAFNGGIKDRDITYFEFTSQEDLTQFVLTWS